MKNKNKELLDNWKTLIHRLEIQYDGFTEPLTLSDEEWALVIEFVERLLEAQKEELDGEAAIIDRDEEIKKLKDVIVNMEIELSEKSK